MDIVPDTASFTIIHRDHNGRPDRIYPWDSAVTTYLAAAINICRGMLNQDVVRHAFTQFIIDAGSEVPGWKGESKASFFPIVFINAILHEFPLVFVDDSLRNQGQVARGIRRPWNGVFHPRNIAIVLNGSRVRDMCDAARMAQQVNTQYSNETTRFRGFMFLFTNIFMHELGHLFITFLTWGRANTPSYIYGSAAGVSEGTHNYGQPRGASEGIKGEAGRKLETLLFGGVLGFYRQLITDDEHQPGVPFLTNLCDTRRILEESIDDTLKHRFHEYKTSKVVLTTGLPKLGDDQPPAEPITDPFRWPETAELLKSNPSPTKLLVGRKSNLYKIPVQGWDPDLRIQAEGGETGRRSEGFWDY